MHTRCALALLACLVIGLEGQAPPPFSPRYGEALRDVLQLEEADVAGLERRLASNPEDFAVRLKLMAYHARADRVSHPEDRAKRLQLMLWLVEHHPESEILHSYAARFSPGELSDAGYRRAIDLWERA